MTQTFLLLKLQLLDLPLHVLNLAPRLLRGGFPLWVAREALVVGREFRELAPFLVDARADAARVRADELLTDEPQAARFAHAALVRAPARAVVPLETSARERRLVVPAHSWCLDTKPMQRVSKICVGLSCTDLPCVCVLADACGPMSKMRLPSHWSQRGQRSSEVW